MAAPKAISAISRNQFHVSFHYAGLVLADRCYSPHDLLDSRALRSRTHARCTPGSGCRTRKLAPTDFSDRRTLRPRAVTRRVTDPNRPQVAAMRIDIRW